MRLACLVVLAACGGSTASQSTAIPANTKLGPTTPAPKVSWIDNGFETPQLPAVSKDGQVVVLATHDNDGGRGLPNLTLVVIDRKDHTIAKQVVLTADELEKAGDDGPDGPKQLELIKARIVTANAWLTKQHEQRDLVPLVALAPQPNEGDDGERRATGGDVAVDWWNSSLAITKGGAKLLARDTPKDWLAPDHKMCATCSEVCHNPAYLKGAFVDVNRAIAVVEVSYKGTDSCWEPADQQHVVTW